MAEQRNFSPDSKAKVALAAIRGDVNPCRQISSMGYATGQGEKLLAGDGKCVGDFIVVDGNSRVQNVADFFQVGAIVRVTDLCRKLAVHTAEDMSLTRR